MDLRLQGLVACITGGSEGIGRAAAIALATEGCHVVICARRRAKLDEAAAMILAATGRAIEAVQADVTQVADIEALMSGIAQRHGRLDLLVNNAGTGIYKPFAEVTDDELQRGMDINFFAQFRVTRAALALLRKSEVAQVINVSGRTAIRGNFPPGSSCTGPAKAAEVRFSIDLATELADDGIRVNCVVPGVVASEERFRLWEREAGQGDDVAAAERARHEREASGRRWAAPADVAAVIAFLASPVSWYVNGVALTVDGGPHVKSYVTQLHSKPG